MHPGQRWRAVLMAGAVLVLPVLARADEFTFLSRAGYNGPGNGSDVAECVAVAGNGDVIVAGSEYDSVAGENWRIRRYDATLTTLLATTDYNGPGNSNDEILAVAVDAAGNVVVAGWEWSTGAVRD